MLAIQRRKIYNVVLFCVIFCVVGGLFILYHRVVPSSDEAIEYIGDISPLLRVGTAHPFLANLVKEIGGSYVTVISVSESTTQDESPTDICSKMSVFFGLNKQVDGWVQDICESKDDSFVDVFLDSYVGIPIDQDSVASSSLQTSRSFSISDKGFYWLSTQGGKDMARAIAKILSEADPVHKVSYLDNAYTVAYQLDDVYGSIKDPIYNLHIAPIIVWGDEWQELIAEYDGHIVQTIDPIQNEKERASSIQNLANYLQKNERAVVIGDLRVPFNEIKKIYPNGARRIVILDPMGDFSDILPYKAFIQQNLLRITRAL